MSLARLKAGKALLACALAIGLMPTTALAGELDDDISAQEYPQPRRHGGETNIKST